MPIGIPVILLDRGWKFATDENGQYGTRTFIEASALPHLSSQDLPVIGDPWDDEHSSCLVKSVEESYLNENSICPKTWVVVYSSANQQIETGQKETDYPTSLSSGSEFITWTPPKAPVTWQWAADNKAITQVVFKNTILTTISLKRVIKDIDWFMTLSATNSGRVNNNPWYGRPVGGVLYEGCGAEEFRSKIGARRWLVTLNFVYRTIPELTDLNIVNDHWQYILREDTGLWDKPMLGANSLYRYGDLKQLTEWAGDDINPNDVPGYLHTNM